MDFGKQCWFLTGPTASGKTATSLALAQQIDAEIISLDSMAIYRGMDIGTAKPSKLQQQTVPHHLIDILEPSDEYSVAQYLSDAAQICQAIFARKRNALFVGGTPLYLKSLLRGIFESPPANWEIRNQLMQAVEVQGSEALHRRLQEVDPLAAQRIHANDVRRIVRALEVYQSIGQPISAYQSQFEQKRLAAECRVFTLTWSRPELNQRIDLRVEQMFAEGLVAEIEALLESTTFSRTASQAVGYREVLEHLQGVRNLSETVELIQLRTRQFAKRQMTWFRSLSECEILELSKDDQPETLAARIHELGKGRSL